MFFSRSIRRGTLIGLLTASVMLAAAAPLPKLQNQNGIMVDPQGNPVEMRGCNLGSWFLIEVWMLAQGWEGPTDQYSIEQILSERFGEAEKDRLMEVYKQNWITEADFDVIRSYRFNVVRLPFWYRMLSPEKGELDERGFQWLERAVDMAESRGIYTILDMHGVPGGQSGEHHTGRGGQNKIWTDPEAQEHFAWLWGEIAKRFKGRSAVVAYDLMNEPYGLEGPPQVPIFERAYREVRRFDPETLVFFHGHWSGFEYFGDPKERGWTNIGYQMHYYPGLFGSPTTFREHRRHLNSLARVAETTKKWQVPFLVGEMNVVFDKFGGEMMRRYYDLHASHGWWTTMWSYKVLGRGGGTRDSWGMVSNAEPFEPVDFRTASKEEIEAQFRWFGSMEVAVNEQLRGWLAPVDRAAPAEFELEKVRETAPQGSLPGWSLADIGGARVGGLEVLAGDRFALYGGGEDIWGSRDQARLLYQEVEGDFDLAVRLESIEDLETYSKAGLIARAGLSAEAAALMFSSFPSGTLQLALRRQMGAEMSGVEGPEYSGAIGADIRLSRRGNSFETFVRRSGEEMWEHTSAVEWPEAPSTLLVGLVALSHDNEQLIRVEYSKLELVRR